MPPQHLPKEQEKANDPSHRLLAPKDLLDPSHQSLYQQFLLLFVDLTEVNLRRRVAPTLVVLKGVFGSDRDLFLDWVKFGLLLLLQVVALREIGRAHV